MDDLFNRPQPKFCGNPEDLEQFPSYASSPIRHPARKEAKTAWTFSIFPFTS